MIEELPDDIENDVLDDIEPVGDESSFMNTSAWWWTKGRK